MKGICFIEPLHKAVVNGTKTQTRRIMKPQPKGALLEVDELGVAFFSNGEYFEPKYKVGEILYIKEPYFKLSNIVWYKYDEQRETEIADYLWKNNLPEKYARYFIEITDVRCERLQDISDDDCLKEGICDYEYCNYVSSGNGEPFEHYYSVFYYDTNSSYNTPQLAYAALIDKINGKGTWHKNPFVWVYSFKLYDKNKDFALAY